MKTRTDRHGTPLCLTCGVAATAHPSGCEASDILTESVRQVIARSTAQRQGADVATRLALETVGEWMRANGYAVVTPALEIVEVF